MATPSRIVGDQYFANTVTFGGDVNLPDGVVDDADIANGANVDADKLEHIHVKTYAQPNTTATTETKAVHVVVGATGVIRSFSAGSIGICAGAATITVDLRKNGTTVLSSVVTLNSSSVARVAQAGTLSVTSLAVGDVLEVVATATAGGGTLGTGLFAHVTLSELAS